MFEVEIDVSGAGENIVRRARIPTRGGQRTFTIESVAGPNSRTEGFRVFVDTAPGFMTRDEALTLMKEIAATLRWHDEQWGRG